MSWLTNFNKDDDENKIIINIIKGKNINCCSNKDVYFEINSKDENFISQNFENKNFFDINYEIKLKCDFTSLVTIKCYVMEFYFSKNLLGEIKILSGNYVNIQYDASQPEWYNLYNKNKIIGQIYIKIGVERVEEKKSEEIYEIANVIAEENNSSAKRSLKIAEDIKNINFTTLNTLVDQGEQVNKMIKDTNTIHNNMRKSERKIRSIESSFGTLKNKFTKPKNKKIKKPVKFHEIEKDKTEHNLKNKKSVKFCEIEKNKNDVNYNFSNEKINQTFKDTDLTLSELSNALDDVKNISLQINQTMKGDIKELENLNNDVETVIPKMDKNTKRARIIIKK